MSERVPRRVNVTIDRLVLRGFAPGQRAAIAAALKAELRSQLAEPANASRLGPSRLVASLRTDPIRLTPEGKRQDVGGRAAQSLARSLRS